MTTQITIGAHSGWDVTVTAIPHSGIDGMTTTVKAGEVAIFHVFEGQDLRIHEVKPDTGATTADFKPPHSLLQFFAYAHLPLHLHIISKPFGLLAEQMDAALPDGAEKTEALRKLLESKDCAVRAILFKP